ncbi:CAS1 domain-containing protein 1-like isoform X1 [Hibiscus syriacus]|uniref:CAS1 domain-containing protein 1-like isoform X1 n=1 Tax=Hibiscus syriacus TaxID=106335 RepID=A0A6A3CAQ5_HIBSY|nr:CAS1 domain-containing protein 1-like isoform X1 [Hibiscus syriacus]
MDPPRAGSSFSRQDFKIGGDLGPAEQAQSWYRFLITRNNNNAGSFSCSKLCHGGSSRNTTPDVLSRSPQPFSCSKTIPQAPRRFPRQICDWIVCTLAASAGYGLSLALTQFCFQKVVEKHVQVGMEGFGQEMERFELGKLSYVNVLVWIAIGWQVFSIGAVGLIMEASSLFSNVISTLGLPIVPVFAMVFFHPIRE